MVSHNGSLYLIGGNTKRGLSKDIFEQQTKELSDWRKVSFGAAAAPWAERAGMAVVWLKDRFFLMGGAIAKDTYAKDVWTTPMFGHDWTPTNDAGWSPRAYFGVAVLGDTVFVLAGQSQGAAGPVINRDVWSWSGLGEWRQHPVPPWPERYHCAAAAHEGNIWMAGGKAASTAIYGDVWVSADGSDWTKVTGEAQFGNRYQLTLTSFMHKLWVVGGAPNSGAYWSANGTVWQAVQADASTPVGQGAGFSTAATVDPLNDGQLWMANGIMENFYISTYITFEPCKGKDCRKALGEHGVCTMPHADTLDVACACDNGGSAPDCSTPVPVGPGTPSQKWWLVVAVSAAAVLLISCVAYALRPESAEARAKAYLRLEDGSDLSEDWLINPKALKLEKTPIGAGGFAQIYRGTLEGAPVAVKQIHAHLMSTSDREVLYSERFKLEAAMMARLYHPCLQGLLGICVEPSLCLVTELAPFGSLSDVMGAMTGAGPDDAGSGAALGAGGGGTGAVPAAAAAANGAPAGAIGGVSASAASTGTGGGGGGAASSTLLARGPGGAGGPLDLPRLMKVLHQVASGVHFLHTRSPRIVHRDLNPNNVLVYDLSLELLDVKVADFGLSKEVALEQTMTGFLGSPSYIAPEILTDSASYDEKVDVYSYGIMVWAVAQYLHLTSRRPPPPDEVFRAEMGPYRGMSPWQIVARVRDGLRPKIPPCEGCPGLKDLMQACWDGEPSRRPHFDDVLARLEALDPSLHDVTRNPNDKEKSMLPDSFVNVVAPHLLISSLSGVRSVAQLRQIQISHVLNTATRVHVSGYPDEVNTLVLNIDDTPETDLLAMLPKAAAFIEKGRRSTGCLVHCLAGTSRSVAIVTAYLMVAYGMRDDAALQLVTDRHPQARPNPGFRRQLYELNRRDHPARLAAEAAVRKAARGRDMLPLVSASMRRDALLGTTSGHMGIGGPKSRGGIAQRLFGGGRKPKRAAHRTMAKAQADSASATAAADAAASAAADAETSKMVLYGDHRGDAETGGAPHAAHGASTNGHGTSDAGTAAAAKKSKPKDPHKKSKSKKGKSKDKKGKSKKSKRSEGRYEPPAVTDETTAPLLAMLAEGAAAGTSASASASGAVAVDMPPVSGALADGSEGASEHKG